MNYIALIQFSSKVVYTHTKNVIKKDGILLYNNFETVIIKTKKKDEKKDMYAIISYDDSDYYVVKYLGYVNDEILEHNLAELSCLCNWKNISIPNIIDLTENRVNFTDKIIYSIDPHGCRDIDDAIHIEINDNIMIYIHIADVSSYIIENSDLDNELQKRIESVYLTDKQYNMIPDTLSINCMSLLENQLKRAFTVIVTLNNNYDIIDVNFVKSMIKVTKNLSYEEANNLINNDIAITNMFNIAQKIKIGNMCNYDMHDIIALYMILCNHVVAKKLINYNNTNALVRIQNDIMKDNAEYISNPKSFIHNGLHLDCYTHFTSPIRRYADIIVHRQLYDAINNKNFEINNNICNLNKIKKHYKAMQRYQKIVILSYQNIQNNTYDAQIIYFSTELIRFYVKFFDISFDHYIYNKNTKHLFNINISDNMLIINDKTYLLNQIIKIKIIFTKMNIKKVIIEILE